jgi:tRNA dimethylallyltransferase
MEGDNLKNKVLIIVGPTAVGKTALSIKLAKDLNGEIISGDSMQVYRGLDIGTAKITQSEMDGIKHHLINIRNVNQRYSAAEFVQEANYWISDIISRGKLPIIVGGTGFYIQALTDGLNLGGDNYVDNDYRRKLQEYANKNGKYSLWKCLEEIDSISAKKIGVSNERRIIRALEVFHNTGEKFSEQTNKNVNWNFHIIGLNTNREVLYNRINLRVDRMISNGLQNEVKYLLSQGDFSLPAWKGIGYREFIDYYTQSVSLDDTKELIKKDSRHYAKRQLTWFRNKMNVNWYDIISNMHEYNKIKKDTVFWLNNKN